MGLKVRFERPRPCFILAIFECQKAKDMKNQVKYIVDQLEKDERLIQVVEDAIAEYQSGLGVSALSESQKKELDERRARFESDLGQTFVWEEVEKQIAALNND